jgi:hypothetical protein
MQGSFGALRVVFLFAPCWGFSLEIFMLSNAVFFKTAHGFVETLDEAVRAAVEWGEAVHLLNPTVRCVLPEVAQLLGDRVCTSEAPDEWPGADYEADVVRPEWRRYRMGGDQGWRRYGPAQLMAVAAQVRA